MLVICSLLESVKIQDNLKLIVQIKNESQNRQVNTVGMAVKIEWFIYSFRFLFTVKTDTKAKVDIFPLSLSTKVHLSTLQPPPLPYLIYNMKTKGGWICSVN